jgi:dGTP triphosphohydrolase
MTLNPPFGHSGEKQLENISLLEMVKYKEFLSAKEWQDLMILRAMPMDLLF